MSHKRDIYLKIEKLPGYSPVMPAEEDHHLYGRDCMRQPGHEDALIPPDEVELRRIDAVIYREYTDAAYTMPKNDKLVPADIHEPPAYARVPGTVIYTEPGERLHIHVYNCDDEPHSFHLHGLEYGIDSDGVYPLGIEAADGRRSDEICPGESWTYVFDATEENLGAWPFHDHYRHIESNVARGLFGGLIVREPKGKQPDHEVPMFFHKLAGPRRNVAFNSGDLQNGQSFAQTFSTEGVFSYFCQHHNMTGTITVQAVATGDKVVSIEDNFFNPADITIGVGDTITWTNNGSNKHTVTESAGTGKHTHALNGRAFVGNSPTIAVESGDRIRWYVFNLDLSSQWHNFHIHAQRWRWGHEIVDTRSLGPAESFTADTIAPPVLLTDPFVDRGCADNGSKKYEKKERPKKYKVCADFPFHCHVEEHMMGGMIGTVRVKQVVSLTERDAEALGHLLPEACGDHCPEVDLARCKQATEGRWDRHDDLPIFAVHAALLNTGQVLLWSGTAEIGGPDYPLESRLWDPSTNQVDGGPQSFTNDLFCAGHAYLSDGRVLVAGGSASPGVGIADSVIFDPSTSSWTAAPAMNRARWYPTLLTLEDGRILALSGRGGQSEPEVFDGTTWQLVAGTAKNLPELYPSAHLVPAGVVFYSRCGWGAADAALTQTGHFTITGTSANYANLGLQNFPDRQEGVAVLLIDDSVAPAGTRLMVFGGGNTLTSNPQSGEVIDLTTLSPAPSWQRLADMNNPRKNVNATVLPDGKVLIVGGRRSGGRFGANDPVFEPELYDPESDGWTVLQPMQDPRGYHSVVVLLPDGRVLATGGPDGFDNQRTVEVFSPGYMFAAARPDVTGVPANVGYGATFTVGTANPNAIAQAVMIRPTCVTHHTDGGGRWIRLQPQGVVGGQLQVRAPTSATVAPPGPYLFYLVDTQGTPSVGQFVQVS